MHYGDEQQLKEAELELVIYKHEVCGSKFRRNKNGIVSKRCVDYEICSVRSMKKFNPRVFVRIMKDPYKHLSASLDFLPTEEFVLIKIKDMDGYGKIEIKPISVVSTHPDESMRLH
jgi:hypothetical protein